MGWIKDFLGGKTSSKSSSTPWKEQQPYLEYGFEQADDMYRNGGLKFTPYKSNWVAHTPQNTRQGWQMTANRAGNAPIYNPASDQFQQTQNGRFLNKAPQYRGDARGGDYYDPGRQNLKPFFNQARKEIDSQFASDGRYGSGLHKTALGEEFGQIAAGFANDERDRQFGLLGDERNRQTQFNNAERNRQVQSLSYAPALDDMRYAGADRLMNIGQQQQLQDQSKIDAKREKWDMRQSMGSDALSRYMELIMGDYGGNTRGSNTDVAAGLANILSLGKTGVKGV